MFQLRSAASLLWIESLLGWERTTESCQVVKNYHLALAWTLFLSSFMRTQDMIDKCFVLDFRLVVLCSGTGHCTFTGPLLTQLGAAN